MEAQTFLESISVRLRLSGDCIFGPCYCVLWTAECSEDSSAMEGWHGSGLQLWMLAKHFTPLRRMNKSRKQIGPVLTPVIFPSPGRSVE